MQVVIKEKAGCVQMKEIIVYHGSNVEVIKPQNLQNGFYKDFGYGFYCTKLEKQARRWALTRKGESIVNRYYYIENTELKTKVFSDMTEEWLAFVVECRMGTPHDFDIVEGPMADDQMWNFVEEYVKGRISKRAFWELVKFNHPTHQIVYCTDAALKTLRFEGSEKL